jgi:hypothetical protein
LQFSGFGQTFRYGRPQHGQDLVNSSRQRTVERDPGGVFMAAAPEA